MSKSFEVVVIGCGPAGLAAATAAAEAGASVLALDRMGPGGQLMNLGPVRHYPEMAAGETGPDLVARLAEAAMAAGAELGFGEVVSITPAAPGAGPWTVATEDESFVGQSLVLATGLGKGTTGLADEAGFEGQGLSHCAHCDGPLYQGQTVVVAGAGEWALHEASDLAAVAGRVALVVPRHSAEDVRGAFAGHGAVEVIGGEIAALVGSDGLEEVHVTHTDGTHVVAARALFVYDGRRPSVGPFAGLVARGEDGGVVADAEGATSVPGLFAAGNVRAGARERIGEAIADGRRAGQNAARWVKAG